MVWEHAEVGCVQIFDELLQGGDTERVQEYAARCSAFAEQVLDRHNDLAEIQSKIEKIAPPRESERQDKLTVAQCVWALHYLLTEAGLNYAATDMATTARFISALTPHGYENVYKRVKDKYGERTEKTARNDLAAVRAHFARLGLDGIVARITREMEEG